MAQFDLKLRRFFSGQQGRLWFLTLALAVLVVVILLAACTGGKNEPASDDELGQKGSPAVAGGNKAALCKFDADFHQAGKGVNGEEESIALVKKFEPKFNKALADAPSDIKPDVQTLITGLREIAATNDQDVPGPLAAEIEEAGNRLDAYCGISD